MRAFVIFVFALGLLTACNRNDGSAPAFGSVSIGPAERALVTANPLQRPPTLDLPPPTPGQGNRANPTQAAAR